MVPTAYVFLDSLPLTPNGKFDRKALPEPGSGRPNLDNPYVVAETAIEKRLVGIWEDALGIEGIGINDDFLDLGGDSLLAARAVSKVIQVFQIDVPITILFDSPTISEMASSIVKYQADHIDKCELERILSVLESEST